MRVECRVILHSLGALPLLVESTLCVSAFCEACCFGAFSGICILQKLPGRRAAWGPGWSPTSDEHMCVYMLSAQNSFRSVHTATMGMHTHVVHFEHMSYAVTFPYGQLHTVPCVPVSVTLHSLAVHNPSHCIYTQTWLRVGETWSLIPSDRNQVYFKPFC